MFATVHEWVPGVEATTYEVATPSAVKVTVILSTPEFAAVGCASAVPGVMAADSADVTSVSPLPLGVIVNLYEVPVVRPVTVQFCEPVRAEALTSELVGPEVVYDVPL